MEEKTTTKTNKYTNGKIYKIISDSTDQIYIGSTCEPRLCNRMRGHRNNLRRYKDGKTNYITSFELLDKYEDCKIILIEDFPCENKDQLTKRERYWIEQNKTVCVNKSIPSRTKEGYYNDNKNNILEKAKEYYDMNKHMIIHVKSQKLNCECGSQFRKGDKARHLNSKKHQNYISSLQVSN